MSTTAVRSPAEALSPAERAVLARAVLTRAEQRTGTVTWVRRPPGGAPGGQGGPVEVSGVVSTDGAVEVAVEVPVEVGSGARVLPVHPPLSGLLPGGGLDRGSTLVVDGSTSLVLALLAATSQAGGWAALVGLPRVGVLAAHQLGLDLARLVLVPAPGADGPTVVAALLDGVDAVVVGDVALSDADRRRLSARARERGAVLVSTTPWPGANVTLTAETVRWEGLGRGEGRLRTRRLTVRGGGRGAATRGWSTEVVVPPTGQGVPDEPGVPGVANEPDEPTVPIGRAGAVVQGPWEGRRAG